MAAGPAATLDAPHTAQIPLGRGLFATIDAADAPLVAGRRWEAKPSTSGRTTYARSIPRHGWPRVYLHRLILGEVPPGKMIDHEDFNGLNCCRANLRIVTPAESTQHRRPNAGRRWKGIFPAPRGRWRAEIGADGGRRKLGYFRTPEAAARAYDAAARELHGEFAVLNFTTSNSTYSTKTWGENSTTSAGGGA